MEFVIFITWLVTVLAMIAAIAVLTLAIIAWAGPKMKQAREQDTKSQAVLNKSGRGDIRIKK